MPVWINSFIKLINFAQMKRMMGLWTFRFLVQFTDRRESVASK